MKRFQTSRSALLFIFVALLIAFAITRGFVQQANYPDAYYHFNAAHRLVTGEGLTDAYLWTYIGAPDELPAPSHLYWMPLTSLTAALGMSVLNAPGDYVAAQFPFTLLFAGTAIVGFWLGKRLDGSNRHAWVAGLLVLFSGFFTRFWGATDTFALYALIGSLCLVWIGLALSAETRSRQIPLWILAGVFAGLSHLTRADGLLMLIVGWAVIIWEMLRESRRNQLLQKARFTIALRRNALWLLIFTGAYLVTMLPWFVRNMQAIGSPLPLGGTQSIWFTEYNDLFSYPSDASPQTLFSDGLDTFISSRWEAFTNNLGTFIAVEGWVILSPLMLIGLWQHRQQKMVLGFGLYALGLHVAMSVVFPYPGYRGGLLHSAAALIPWWAVLAVLGLDSMIDWIAARRRTWKPAIAKPIFSIALVGLAFILSLSSAFPSGKGFPGVYRKLLDLLPPDAKIMINDPAGLYYFTGLGGVVLPNESPDLIPNIARTYDVDYLLIEQVRDNGFIGAIPAKLRFDPDNPPSFLKPIAEFDLRGMRLYAINHE